MQAINNSLYREIGVLIAFMIKTEVSHILVGTPGILRLLLIVSFRTYRLVLDLIKKHATGGNLLRKY